MTRKKGSSCLGRIFRLTLAILVMVIIVGAVGGALVATDYSQFQETLVLDEEERQTLVIEPDTNWPQVVDRIAEAELVSSTLYFDIWGRRTGLAEEVKAGTFFLEGPMELDQLAEVLRQGGQADQLVVTFPEGLTIFDMADRYEEAGLGTRDDFLTVARDVERFDWLPSDIESLEGYLYPDTYRFAPGTPAEFVVDRLVEQWRDVSAPLFEEYADAFEALQQEYDLDRQDVVTMASLIERETSIGGERDLIARVFYNRLDRGMQLQTDPTCVYGEATYQEVPTRDRCRDPLNRYSTYVIEGLPPGPIANPSRASLEAALMPSEEPDAQEFLFFVSRRDGSGEHHFSTNYDEHRRAVQRYLID